MSPTDLAQRFLPVVVGARVGDAMGSPTEGLSAEEIRERFGWVDAFTGDGTDDSLMATKRSSLASFSMSAMVTSTR